jgi:hypothetical protein
MSGDLKEPDGSLRDSPPLSESSLTETIIICLVASGIKQCLRWGPLCYLWDACASPKLVQQWEKLDLNWNGNSALSAQAIVCERCSWADLQRKWKGGCVEEISVPGIHWNLSMTCPLQLITLMGGRLGDQPGGLLQPRQDGCIDCKSDRRLWRWMGIHLAFIGPLIVEKLSSGPGTCLLNWALSQVLLPTPFFPTPSCTPNQVCLPWNTT